MKNTTLNSGHINIVNFFHVNVHKDCLSMNTMCWKPTSTALLSREKQSFKSRKSLAASICCFKTGVNEIYTVVLYNGMFCTQISDVH